MQTHQSIRAGLYSVLIAIDQLGNALAGGYADSTISARVGYNAHHAGPAMQNYWRLLEWVINYTFLPLDGPNHCYQAYLAGNKQHFRDGSDLMRVILSSLIFFNAMPIAIVTRILAWRKSAHQV